MDSTTHGKAQGKVDSTDTGQHLSRARVETMWDHEYLTQQRLPTTTNFLPSRCLSHLADIINVRPGMTVLDLGCGNGRHSSYFALHGCKVYALDISGCALDIAYKHAQDKGCAKYVTFFHGSALDTIPVIESGFDIVLDSYMACHITSLEERNAVLNQIKQVLSPSGIFISFAISRGDSFYSRYADGSSDSCAVVCDPHTRIEKLLITEQFAKEELGRAFEVKRIGRVPLVDTVGGQLHEKEAIYTGAVGQVSR